MKLNYINTKEYVIVRVLLLFFALGITLCALNLYWKLVALEFLAKRDIPKIEKTFVECSNSSKNQLEDVIECLEKRKSQFWGVAGFSPAVNSGQPSGVPSNTLFIVGYHSEIWATTYCYPQPDDSKIRCQMHPW